KRQVKRTRKEGRNEIQFGIRQHTRRSKELASVGQQRAEVPDQIETEEHPKQRKLACRYRYFEHSGSSLQVSLRPAVRVVMMTAIRACASDVRPSSARSGPPGRSA